MLNLHSSVNSLNKISQDFNKSADKISKFGLTNSEVTSNITVEDTVQLSEESSKLDITHEFIQMQLSEICYKANAAVIKEKDELTGTIIDLKA